MQALLFGGDRRKVMTADKIIIGKIYTGAEDNLFAEGMAVKDGKFIYVGKKEGLEQYIGDKTEFIEKKTGLVIPGMTEGHAHICSGADLLFGVSLRKAESVEEYLVRIKKYMSKYPEKEVITGFGFETGIFDDIGPTAELLDMVSMEKPLIMQSIDAHSYWVNSKVLELAGINETTTEVENGMIVRYPGTKKPTGWLEELAGNLLGPLMPERTLEQYKEAILYFQEIALSNGEVMAFEPMYDRRKDYELRCQAYHELAEEGKLKVTFRAAYTLEPDDNPNQVFETMDRIRKSVGNCEKFQMNTMKIFIDGVVEGHTAFLREDYENTPGNRGESMFEQERLNEAVKRACEKGYWVHTHAIGDAAADVILEAYEYAQKSKKIRTYRNAMTHLQILAPDQIEKMKELECVAVVNPYWHRKDKVFYDNLEVPFLGRKRAEKQYPVASLIRSKIPVSQASDWPVTPDPRPMASLHFMLNRKNPDHMEEEDFWMEEAVTVEEAMKILTYGGAYQLDMETRKGTIETGKDADFVLLSEDVFTMNTKKLSTVVVEETYIEGERVWADSINCQNISVLNGN